MDRELVIIDAGVEHIHVRIGSERIVIENTDRCDKLMSDSGILDALKDPGTELYITGKLAEMVRGSLDRGQILMPSACLWAEARALLSKDAETLGVIDLSASGYMVICVDASGELKDDRLVANPKCGAGCGINLNRILEKLAVSRDQVDPLLAEYLGDGGKEKRSNVTVRADRCGVFASSATISDKNQGIPLDYALAVTMKSEVLKACKKMLPNTDVVHLTGRVFSWQYTRDCAEDYLGTVGVKNVVYDGDQVLLLNGAEHLAEEIGKGHFKPLGSLRAPERLTEFPSFQELRSEFEKEDLYKRLADPEIQTPSAATLTAMPVNVSLDVGSTMAKMVIADAADNDILFKNSYENHGDTIETIKHIFKELTAKGIDRLNIQHIGVTGSGRYQVQRVLREVYPGLGDRIFVLVENYAHAHGSIEYAKEYVKRFEDVNKDFYVLVDIGGEDTKVSVISLNREELFDNVMNIKCSAGTGSLMDTLKALFNVEDIEDACRRAYHAPKAYEINATCAVFLMENAKKMQAMGYSKEEILASCNYAIVENMARTLWDQIEFPENAVVLLHGQTMLSDPLPLAVTRRVQELSKMPCIVPPLPGHRACIGLIESIESKEAIDNPCALSDLIDLRFDKKIVMCKGVACGDANASCARTRLTSTTSDGRISVLLGGCTAVNELSSNRAKKEKTTDAYKEIWSYIDSRLPRSSESKRLVIPRCFAVSEQAYFLSRIFENLGIPVHVDNVQESDVLNGQPLFNIDICAPLIGAAGQFMRLSREDHGWILVPQIDYLPTNDTSIGRTCTTNQGGVVIATHIGREHNPSANFLLLNLMLRAMDASYIAGQWYPRLQDVFGYYGLHVSRRELERAISRAIDENAKLKHEVADRVVDYLNEAVEQRLNVSIICAREYILTPEIYDSHAGKLLKDKGVIAIPSYAFEASLDQDYNYIYWRNPHDIITKVKAVTEKRLHQIVHHPELRQVLKKIETGQTDTLISIVQVSTFRCGPDTVTIPTTTEIAKNIPSLFLQSDAMINELAHLENRVNTHINQLDKGLHEEFSHSNFDIELVDLFGCGEIDRETDAVYLPTLHDNRILTSVLRGGGITAIDNYADETYNLEDKIRMGRRYASDSVCAPLAAVFADILLAAEDFARRKKDDDPLVKGKTRALVLDIKGTGPCRQGQYYEMHKLMLHRRFGSQSHIRLLVAHEKNNYNIGFDEWVLYLAYQGLILHAVLHSILLEAGGRCRDEDEYHRFYSDYQDLKGRIYSILESETEPSRFAELAMKYVRHRLPGLAPAVRYIGLREALVAFRRKWPALFRKDRHKLNIYIEGEAYIRVAQIQEIYNALIDSIGFNAFNLSHSPLWCYLEWLFEERILNSREAIDIRNGSGSLSPGLLASVEENKQAIKHSKSLVRKFRYYLAKPLYLAAGLEMPHRMASILERTTEVISTKKPHGELQPYVGEAMVKIEDGVDLFLNVAPEGCMVSSMGQSLTAPILKAIGNKTARIQDLFTLNGEINIDQLQMALLKTLGPVGYYRK